MPILVRHVYKSFTSRMGSGLPTWAPWLGSANPLSCVHTHIYIYICPSIQEALLPNKLKGPNFIERCRAHLGIPHSARASPKLFTTKTLLSGGTTSYCALSQKVLKGAAARMLIYWLCSVLAETDDGSLYSKLLGFAKCKCPMKLFSPPAR